MKKKIVLVLILISVLALGMLVSACVVKEDDIIYPQKVYEINNVEDFLAIRDNAGYKYKNAVYSINVDLDLTSANWDGFGESPDKEEAFAGTIKGNGHTIKYLIDIPSPEGEIDSDLREEYGLVKYGNNAHFLDFNIEIKIKVPNEAEKIYIAGVCAHLCGDSSVKDISVSGEIETSLRDLREDEVLSDGSIYQPQTETQENNKFCDANIGGVLGYAKGSISLENIHSSVDITVNRNKFCIIDNLNVGGIAGLVRPVDLSKANGNILHHKDLSYSGNISLVAGSAYAGGIFGALHHSIVDDVKVGDSGLTNFQGSALGRLSLGSVAGILENSVLDKANVRVAKIVSAAISPGKKVSFNLGGVAGLLKNTSISHCDTETFWEVRNGTYFYAGGLAGVCYDSTIDKSVSSGGISILSSGQIVSDILSYNFSYSQNTDKIADYYINSRNGGIVGRMEGQSVLGENATTFKAYQPIVGEIVERIEIVVLKKDETELENWINKSHYNRELMDIKETQGKDVKEDEQQYTISNFHKIVDNEKLTYQSDNAKVYLDKALWEASSKSYDLGVGTEQEDDSVFLSLQAEIAGIN